MFASVFVVLRGPTGELLLRTTELDGEDACSAAVTWIRASAGLASRYRRRLAPQGGHYFELVDAHGHALGFSPLFDSDIGCEAAIAATMACASQAIVVHATPITREMEALDDASSITRGNTA
jgi:hypothetical protein